MEWREYGNNYWIAQDEKYAYSKARYISKTCYYFSSKYMGNKGRHRFDGPAIEYDNGNKEWYYFGGKIECQTQEEFERLIKLKAFF